MEQASCLFFTAFLEDAQFPMPDAQFPIPDAQFPIPDARCPIPDAQLPKGIHRTQNCCIFYIRCILLRKSNSALINISPNKKKGIKFLYHQEWSLL